MSEISEAAKKKYQFDCHGRSSPAYGCSQPGDNSGMFYRVDDVDAETADLRRQLAEAKALAEEYHNQADCYTTAWKQRAEKAEAELAEAKAREERIWKHCKIIFYLNQGHYPLEHAPLANKDMRGEIEKALAKTEGGE